jgi:flotillin
MTTVLIVASVLAVAALAALVIVSKLIYICPPSAVLVFSGKQRRAGGRTVGYRLVQGGRGIREAPARVTVSGGREWT